MSSVDLSEVVGCGGEGARVATAGEGERWVGRVVDFVLKVA